MDFRYTDAILTMYVNSKVTTFKLSFISASVIPIYAHLIWILLLFTKMYTDKYCLNVYMYSTTTGI